MQEDKIQKFIIWLFSVLRLAVVIWLIVLLLGEHQDLLKIVKYGILLMVITTDSISQQIGRKKAE